MAPVGPLPSPGGRAERTMPNAQCRLRAEGRALAHDAHRSPRLRAAVQLTPDLAFESIVCVCVYVCVCVCVSVLCEYGGATLRDRCTKQLGKNNSLTEPLDKNNSLISALN